MNSLATVGIILQSGLLIDADTHHGCDLRLHMLPMPRAGEKAVTVPLGLDAVITRESLEKLIAALRSGRRRREIESCRGKLVEKLNGIVSRREFPSSFLVSETLLGPGAA
jgi:hypothetical protein